jgi:hypothetical protein
MIDLKGIFTDIGGNLTLLAGAVFLGFVIALLSYVFYKRTFGSDEDRYLANGEDLGVKISGDENNKPSATDTEATHEFMDYIMPEYEETPSEGEPEKKAVYLASFNDPFLTPLIQNTLENEGVETLVIESQYDPNKKLKPGEESGTLYKRLYVHKKDYTRAKELLEIIIEELKDYPSEDKNYNDEIL